MSGTEAFLDRLLALDIRLAAEEGRLSVDAPKGAITAELREELARRKAEVLGFLQARGGRWTPSSTGLAIPSADRSAPLPASFAQERLWYFGQLMPESAAYNLHFGWRLQGPLDLDALGRALEDALARHEVLRTTFREVDGRVLLTVHSPQPWRVEATPMPEGSGEAEAMRALEREAVRPFDLARGPMLRATVLRQARDLHWLMVVYHHISGDGWSSAILARELSLLYSAHAAGRAPQLPPLAIQYADYAHWQRTGFANSRLLEALDYWKGRLAGAPAASELPMDRPRPPLPGHAGASSRRIVAPEIRDRLAALARSNRTTLFVAILAAFQALLARQSGQDDVCVGVPVAGRDRSELEPLVGMFINTVVIRTRLSPGLSFEGLLAAVRDEFQGAMAHRDAPFESVAREVQATRDLGRSPVFQVMVNMLNFPIGEPPRFHGLEAEPLPLFVFGQVQSKFDLTLYVYDDRDGLNFSAVYDAQLFDAPRIDSLLAQVAGLFEAVTQDPAMPLHRISLATARTAPSLPDPARSLPPEDVPGVVERVQAHARAMPERIAARDALGGSLRWDALETGANRVANHLGTLGVGPGDRVAVVATRSVQLTLALLGVLKARAAFWIVDPAHPAARTRQCLEVAQPRAWIRLADAPDLEDAMRDAGVAGPVDLRDPAAAWSRAPASAPAQGPAPDELAYVAFTSGSTGLPKAVAGTHRPLAHFFAWHARTFSLGGEDRFSVLSGLAHDPLLRDVLGAAWVGATAFFPDGERMREPGYLADWLAAEGVTICHLTPSMAEVVASRAEGEPPPLAALRLACFGGDALAPATVAAMRRLAPGARYVNFYGATETPQIMGWYPIPEAHGTLPPRVPIGTGIDGVQLLVLGPGGVLAAPGEVGEIHVRTPYLSRGYLGDEALTRERFVAAPSGAPGDRMYRTGDLGRYRPDGVVEFAGRADRQVKVRGFRIELAEVEAALATLEAVDRVLVLTREAGPGDTRLVAYVVYRTGEEPTVSEVRRHLRQRLPDFMVPSMIVALPALPLTPNGKVDRAALPDPFRIAQRAAASEEPPAPGAEQALAQIWREVLQVERVGAHDNFVELGGHSLLALRVATAAGQRLGWRLDPRTLFFQTLRQVAAANGARTAA